MQTDLGIEGDEEAGMQPPPLLKDPAAAKPPAFLKQPAFLRK